MSLDKSIEYGKEFRRNYRGSKRFDKTCRNNGACDYCRNGRQHNSKKRELRSKEIFDEYLWGDKE